jgi:hypothetical protein
MIKFEHTDVMNFEGALRGMRNPLNSRELSDSAVCPNAIGFEDCKVSPIGRCPRGDAPKWDEAIFCIGANDLALAQKLIKAGSDHRKFLRQIFVSVDITAPLYWWKEFDTYKVGTVANSCSTMHTIHKKEFTLDDFSTDKMSSYARDILEDFIFSLNTYRKSYIEYGDKKDWYDIIQSLPSSYNQKRTITLNYETLRNIYGSRHNHKLDEWSVGFMEWIDSLPYAEELIKC